MNIIWGVIIAVGVFFLSYFGFLFCSQTNNSKYAKLKQPILPILLFGFTGFIGAYFLAVDPHDSLFLPSITAPIFIFTVALAYLLFSKRVSANLFRFFFILAVCLCGTFLLPTDFSLTENMLPAPIERIILALIWAVFAFFFPLLNGVDGILSIHVLNVSVGLVLLFIIGTLPLLYASYACVFIGLFLSFYIFNRYPASLTLSKEDSQIIGLLLGGLCLLATQEGDSSCVLILNMYYIYELTTSTFRKLLHFKRNQSLADSSFYSQLAAAGIAPNNICDFIMRINLVLLLMSCFQVYSPNYYTIVLLSLVAVFWIVSRVTSPEILGNGHFLITGSLFSMLRKGFSDKPDSKDK